MGRLRPPKGAPECQKGSEHSRASLTNLPPVCTMLGPASFSLQMHGTTFGRKIWHMHGASHQPICLNFIGPGRIKMDSSNTNGRPFHASVNGKYR